MAYELAGETWAAEMGRALDAARAASGLGQLGSGGPGFDGGYERPMGPMHVLTPYRRLVGVPRLRPGQYLAWAGGNLVGPPPADPRNPAGPLAGLGGVLDSGLGYDVRTGVGLGLASAVVVGLGALVLGAERPGRWAAGAGGVAFAARMASALMGIY